MKINKLSVKLDALRIALIYFILSIVWILCSDQILEYTFGSQEVINTYQTLKGLVFVAITAVVIYLLIRASQKKLKQAHDVIEESEKRYRLLVDESPFIIGLIQDQRIIYANPTACELLEASKSKLFGMSIENVIHPDGLEKVKKRMQRLMDGESGLYPVLERYVSSSGKVIPVEVHATAFTYNNKKAVQVIAIDISDRVTREQKLERILKEKDVLISEIHHRVKNNLAIISALIQLQAYEDNDSDSSEVLLMSLRRISSIALIHEHVYQSDDLVNIRFDKIISELISINSQYFEQAKINKEFKVSPVNINVNQAVPCALFLNETLNFIHNNVVSSLEGSLLTIHLKEQQKACVLSVSLKSEEGTSLIIEQQENGLSFQLIELIGQQLEGEVTTSINGSLNIRLMFDPEETINGTTATISV